MLHSETPRDHPFIEDVDGYCKICGFSRRAVHQPDFSLQLKAWFEGMR